MSIAVCRRCGMLPRSEQPHLTRDDCINELRAENDQLRDEAAVRDLSRHAGDGETNSGRFRSLLVVLDGETMTLKDAAGRLEISAVALYNRIYRKRRHRGRPDIRAIGADVAANKQPKRMRRLDREQRSNAC